MDLILFLMGGAFIIMTYVRRRAATKRHDAQTAKERDAILQELRKMSAEAKRIRALPRDEVDALIAETVGTNSNRI